HEFYELRAAITRELIASHGFNLIAVEADWPDAFRIQRWIHEAPPDADATAALADFTRFPRWKWRNRDIVALVNWLRDHNRDTPASAHVSFYGLDLYSLRRSIEAVLAYLGKVDPAAAERARYRNLRDRHMMETLDELIAHVARRQGRARAIVWAHSSHLG